MTNEMDPDLKKKANDVVVILNNLLLELKDISKILDDDLGQQKLYRWETRARKQIEKNIGTHEALKFKEVNTYTIPNMHGGFLQEQCSLYKGYIETLMIEIVKHPEDILLDSDPKTMDFPTEKSPAKHPTNKVFVVHGHDGALKNETEAFLFRENFHPIILHRQLDEGQTVIEKFEANSDVAYAIILLTPDDLGGLKSEIENSVKNNEDIRFEQRARQNVIFEWGYFVGKLGRPNVCCVYKEGVMLPSDLHGMIYKRINNSIEEKGHEIIREMINAGLVPQDPK